MINSRNINDLHPRVRQMAAEFVKACKDELGVDILITSTFRDFESQNALYAQGRTTPGDIVTNARGGQSYHNYRVAFDFVPMLNGKPNWKGADLFRKCGEVGEKIGLEWAGRWTTFKELAHLQFTGGLTLKDFQAGKRLE